MLENEQHPELNSHSRLNGCGKAFILTSRKDGNGCNFAVLWFTLFYFPIAPIGRCYLRRTGTTNWGIPALSYSTRTSYQIFYSTSFVAKEIILTYLIALLVPIILFGPGVLMMYLISPVMNTIPLFVSMIVLILGVIWIFISGFILDSLYTKYIN